MLKASGQVWHRAAGPPALLRPGARRRKDSDYLAAMAAAANFAFANRQIITHWVRETFEQVLRSGPKDLGLGLVYDVCHNIAKIETHQVDGKRQKLCVHRKGATRAFPPHHPDVPAAYRQTGQPVLIPGDMGRYSYRLVGTEKAMRRPSAAPATGPAASESAIRP